MLVAFLVFTILFNYILAVIALIKNRLSNSSIFHLIATVFFSLWAITNVAAERYTGEIERNGIFNRLAFLFAFLGLIGLTMFCRSFALPFIRKKWSISKKIYVSAGVLMFAGLSYSSLVAGTVEREGNGKLLFLQGPLVPIYLLAFVVILGFAIRNLLVRTKFGNYAEKNQARFIIFGFAMALLIGSATNLIIPAIAPTFINAGFMGAFLTLLLAFPTSYALIKHRLLDIRPLAARGSAILLLLLTMGTIYVIALFNLNRIFISDYQPSSLTLTLYALVMVALGFLLQPLFNVYRRILGRVFLRRIYETQRVINELNNVLVANLKIHALMSEFQRVIRHNLDTQFTIIKLQHKDTVFHQGGKKIITREELAHIDMALRAVLKGHTYTVSIRDIAVDPQKKELSDLMIRHDLAVISAIKQGQTTLGTMYISSKNSELPYTNQDLEIIKIIINQVGLAIQNALLYNRVSVLNDTLQQRVDDATHDLRLSNTKLMALDKAKDEFISIASHQLRTPLTAIKGYLSMVLEGSMGKVGSSQRTVLQQSFDSSQRMAYVVSDLLNLTRIRIGKFAVNAHPINLADIAESEISYLLKQAKYKELTLIYEKPADFPYLMLDEIKLRQIIKNFIYNAIFYTLPGGEIKVELKNESSRVTFKVIDNGIGVPKKEQKHLFTQFYRAKNARDIRPDGTGIGLFIAKKVILAHGGTVLFESEEGKGSTFGFSFSKKRLATAEIISQDTAQNTQI